MESSTGEARVAADSSVGEGPTSFISGMAESVSGSTESKTSSASAKSGSVMHGALCKGVEDSRCSLLACMMPSLPRAVMVVVGKDETE